MVKRGVVTDEVGIKQSFRREATKSPCKAGAAGSAINS